MRTIRRIIIENFLSAAVALAILFAAGLYCLKSDELEAVRLVIYYAAFIVFAFPMITFLECRRIWRGEDDEPITDVTLPALIIGLVLFGCSYLV